MIMTAHYTSSTRRSPSPKDNCGNFLILVDGFDKIWNAGNYTEDELKGYVEWETMHLSWYM